MREPSREPSPRSGGRELAGRVAWLIWRALAGLLGWMRYRFLLLGWRGRVIVVAVALYAVGWAAAHVGLAGLATQAVNTAGIILAVLLFILFCRWALTELPSGSKRRR